MHFKRFGNTYVVRLEIGEEIVETLKQFCSEQGIKLGTITGIGAVDRAEIGYFEISTKEYHSKTLTGDLELAPVAGNITAMDGETYLHLHVNLGDEECRAHAGHLNSAVVSATFEALITSIDGKVERFADEESGLNLLKL